MEEKWSLRAFSETETAERAKAATSKREMDAKANSRARVIYSPSYERRQIVNETICFNKSQARVRVRRVPVSQTALRPFGFLHDLGIHKTCTHLLSYGNSAGSLLYGYREWAINAAQTRQMVS
jgi:hypothetical protein